MCLICDTAPDTHAPALPRRRFLKLAGIGAAGLASMGLRPPDAADPTERHLDLYRIHSRKRLRITYMRAGRYLDGALAAIDLLCQDNLRREHTQMEVALIDQVWMFKEMIAPGAVVEIVSAYRTPKTNAWLRRKSNNVARRSLHMDGRAIDIRLRDVPASVVADVAAGLAMGGVGYYDRSQFVHLDTGRPRRWNI